MKLTRNFTLAELACKDGTEVPYEYYNNARAICERVQSLRTLVGTPILVNSAYRTEAYNKKIGGVPRSQHLTASALDIRSLVWSPEQLATLYQGLIDLGLVPDGGIGVYSTFVHLDLGRPRRWKGK